MPAKWITSGSAGLWRSAAGSFAAGPPAVSRHAGRLPFRPVRAVPQPPCRGSCRRAAVRPGTDRTVLIKSWPPGPRGHDPGGLISSSGAIEDSGARAGKVPGTGPGTPELLMTTSST